jgi:hypothetical protein
LFLAAKSAEEDGQGEQYKGTCHNGKGRHVDYHRPSRLHFQLADSAIGYVNAHLVNWHLLLLRNVAIHRRKRLLENRQWLLLERLDTFGTRDDCCSLFILGTRESLSLPPFWYVIGKDSLRLSVDDDVGQDAARKQNHQRKRDGVGLLEQLQFAAER